MNPAGAWPVRRDAGSAAEFHARPLPEPEARQVWLFAVRQPALVLGSAQPEAHVDAGALAGAVAQASPWAGESIEVARRRSGGSGVLLVPGEVVWVDVLLPAGDRWWDDDVGRATWWLGEVWAEALGSLGLAGVEVHRGRAVKGPWSDRVCFAGLGPGEVSVGGRKVVGISQRRVRRQARFQTAALLRWCPASVAALLGGRAGGPAPAPGLLGDVAAGIGDLLPAPTSVERVEAALLDALATR